MTISMTSDLEKPTADTNETKQGDSPAQAEKKVDPRAVLLLKSGLRAGGPDPSLR